MSRRIVILGSLVPALAVAGGGLLFGQGIDRVLGVAGVVFALGTFVLTQYQAQGPRTRHVLMVPKSRSPFSASVHRGLADRLSATPVISFSVEWPPPDVGDEVDWQIQVLQSQACTAAEGLVIVPAGDDERLWAETVHLTRQGVFVVVVDTKPENAFFAIRGVPRPFFVGSDFTSGGEVLGRELVSLLALDPRRRAVVAGGPKSSWPGRERTRGIATALLECGDGGRTRFVELADWRRDRGSEQITDAVKQELADANAQVVAYCANDKIAEGVERRLLSEVDLTDRQRIGLLGYDGVTNAAGALLIHDGCMTLATVDTRPEEQGRAAGQVLVEEHSGLLPGRGSRYIRPQLVRSALGELWSSSAVRSEV